MLKSRNVKNMLFILLVCITYTFILGNGGCDDTGGGVNYDTAKAAVEAIESSDIGVTLSTVGQDISDAAGESNLSGEIYTAIQLKCIKHFGNPKCE